MSTLYNLEPQPTAKVLLTTTSGDILLELFAKQTPLASRNFLQLCLDGYYDGTVFHRLVPGFVIQGGDPTGTGAGGESSYDGDPFADEFHSRLKFNRRGLLGMANTGKKDDNGSQFFLTLDKTEELQGKNTLFGRVVGDTIYNLMKMGQADLAEEGGDRPLYPTKITGTEIMVSPFEDMVKRIQTAQRSVERGGKKKPKKKPTQNMLSFGGDDEDDAGLAPVAKKPKFNPKVVDDRNGEGVKLHDASKPAASRQKAIPSSPPKPPAKSTTRETAHVEQSSRATAPERSSRSPTLSSSPEPQQLSSVSSLLSKTNAQIAELKASMKRNVAGASSEKEKPKSALEAMVPATSTRGRKRRHGGGNNALAKEERRALNTFNAFKEKLEGSGFEGPPLSKSSHREDGGAEDTNGEKGRSAITNGATEVEGDEEASLCDLHFIANCESCSKWSNPSADVDDDDFSKGGAEWMSHSLSFAKDRLGKNLEWKRKNEEELVVIDPREKEKGLKEGKREKNKERGVWGKSAGRNRPMEKTKG